MAEQHAETAAVYVIATGDPWDGIILTGPFEVMEDAHEWAENNCDHWDCIKLQPPQDSDGDS